MTGHRSAILGGVYFSDSNKVLFTSSNESNKTILELESDAHITGLRVNSSNSLIAVAEYDRVQIWTLEAPIKCIASVNLKTQIFSLAWQQCARFDAGLVCLTASKITSIYAFPGDIPVIEHVEIVDTTNLVLDPVNFGFGSSDSPLGFLSLYLGTRDGELFRLAPFLPIEFEVSESQIDDLKDNVNMDDWSVQFNSWSDVRREKVKVLKRVHSETTIKRKLAPLKLIPYPEELYEEDTLDLQVGCIGWGVDIIVQTTQHYVNFFASYSHLSHELVLINSVKFTNGETQRSVELIGSKHVVVNTTLKTYVLDISAWADAKDDKSEEVNTLTKVEAIDNCKSYFSRKGLVTDANKSWTLKSTDDQLRQQLQSFDIETPSFCGNVELCSELSQKADGLIPKITSGSKISIRNATDLYEFDEIAQKFQNALVSLHKLMVNLRFEREARKHEVLAQRGTLKKLLSGAEELKSKQKGQQINQIVDRQSELRSRIETIKKRVDAQQNQQNIPLSLAELSWFDDLKKGLPAKFARAEDFVSKLQKDLNNIKQAKMTEATPSPTESHEGPKNLDLPHISKIQRRLHDQDLIIKSLLKAI